MSRVIKFRLPSCCDFDFILRMNHSSPILQVTNLVKSYGSFKAVDKLSFEVYKGDVFGFLGPNGAGKSTTLRMLVSLISPDAGEIKLFGRSLQKHRSEVLGRIGCIIEKPDFYKYLSAESNLRIAAGYSGKRIPQAHIQETLEFVGLKGREKDKVKGFSHGMRQRLGIAQTLLHDPDIIILDEPTTGLDPQGIIEIRNLILRLSREKGKTVILSSHLLSEIELIANRMIIIYKGQVVTQGAVGELINEGEKLVALKVSRAEEVAALLPDWQVLPGEPGEIRVKCTEAEIPVLTRALCEKGIDIFSIESKRKLEDYFLNLTYR